MNSCFGTNSKNSSITCSEKIIKISRFCILCEKSRSMGVKNIKSGNNSDKKEKSMKYPRTIANTGENFNFYTQVHFLEKTL